MTNVIRKSPSGKALPFASIVGGYVQADTLAELNALPPFEATLVFLRGIVTNDQVGGVFEVVTGLSADGWDVINTTHLDGDGNTKQLLRYGASFGIGTWLNTDVDTIAFAATGTPVFSTIPHIAAKSGPWTNIGNTQLRWDGTLLPSGSSPPAFQIVTIEGTGTPGETIQAAMVQVAGGPIMLSGAGSTIDGDGNLRISNVFPDVLPTSAVQLAFANLTSTNSIDIDVSYCAFYRMGADQSDII